MTKTALPFIKRYFLLLVLFIACVAFFYFDLQRYLSLESLVQYQSLIKQWSNDHYFLALVSYTLLFTGLIACGIPCATFFCLVGGFLFGAIAVIYAELSTAGGGLILYLTVRTAFGHRIAMATSSWIKRVEKGFQENAFNYLLTLRLVPIFPCWISNISAGILNVPMKTFLAATLIGIFPSTLIYVLAGRSLDKIFNYHDIPVTQLLLTPSIFLPLLGLAVLSLAPVIYKLVKKNNKSS